MAPSQVVAYAVADEIVALFEIEPVEGFVPAGAGELVGRVREAVDPALAAAKAVLEQARQLSPDGVEVKFGVRVTGTMTWIVAKAATEGNFEVTLSWRPDRDGPTAGGSGSEGR